MVYVLESSLSKANQHLSLRLVNYIYYLFINCTNVCFFVPFMTFLVIDTVGCEKNSVSEVIFNLGSGYPDKPFNMANMWLVSVVFGSCKIY